MKSLNDIACILNWIQIHSLELKFNSIQQLNYNSIKLNSYSNEKKWGINWWRKYWKFVQGKKKPLKRHRIW
jgi:hypothetical protein